VSTPTKAGSFPRRIVAGAAVAAIAMSFALTAIVMANNLHQFEGDDFPDGISWDAQGFTGEDCEALDLAPGEVFWHFVQNQVADGTDSGKMTAEFDIAGVIADVDSYKKAGGVLHWSIITGHDTLLSASSNVTSDGEFNLSHICVGPEEQSVGESASEEESVAASASGEQSVEAGTGTPEESTADSSLFGVGSSPLATIAFSLILLASLGGLAYANVKTVRNRI
jgi:hypothetical protein